MSCFWRFFPHIISDFEAILGLLSTTTRRNVSNFTSFFFHLFLFAIYSIFYSNSNRKEKLNGEET